MIKFDNDEFLKTQIYSTNDEYETRCNVTKEIVDDIKQLQQENKQLKEQLDYLRSEEYYNQLRFENEMLQQVVDTNGVPSEVYDYIDCTHRNTELLKENQELKEKINNIKKIIIDNSYNELYEWFNELREEKVIEIVNILDIKKDIEQKRGGINE